MQAPTMDGNSGTDFAPGVAPVGTAPHVAPADLVAPATSRTYATGQPNPMTMAAQPGRSQTIGNTMAGLDAPRYDRLSDMVPPSLREPLGRANGFLLCLFGMFATLSLATWTISDPSLTFANGGDVENWMGFWGASFADFSIQFLGLMSVVLAGLPTVWGLLKLNSRTLSPLRIRAGFALGALVLGAAAMGCLSIAEGWPLETGLGGVVGDAALAIPRAFTGAWPEGLWAAMLFALFVVPAAWCLAHASNLRNGIPPLVNATDHGTEDSTTVPEALHDPYDSMAEDTGRDWGALLAAPLGLLMHLVLSARSAWSKRRAASQHRNPYANPAHAAPSAPQAVMADAINNAHPLPETNPDVQAQSAVAAAMARVDALEPTNPAVEIDPSDPLDLHGGAVAVEIAESQLHAETPPWDDAVEPNTATLDMIPQPVTATTPSLVPQAAPQAVPQPVSQVAPLPVSQRVTTTPDTENNPFVEPQNAVAAPAPAAPRKPVVQRTTAAPEGDQFELPALDLLAEQKTLITDPTLSDAVLEENARQLEGVLEDFGVKGQIIKVRPGPVVTLYELEPAPGVKSSRVIGLAEDIARSMSAIAARVAVVPGRNAIGIELPNKKRQTVYLREQLSSPEFTGSKAKLAMCLGKTIGGEPVIADLAGMPHLLMAGTTGSGKSVGINTMILSLLYRLTPDQCKMIMIDPKMLELSIYDGIPHLLTPVVVDPKKAVVALKWAVREMEERYKKMSKMGVRNIDGFNTRIAEAAAKGEQITRTVQTGFDRHTGEAIYEHEELDLEPMPFIVVIIDEMADLMMVAGKDIEGTVQRLAQMARAAGIHVIMATQRPSVDVITGTIKANFPTRISFQVTSKIDSRTILGEMGAEQLLGMGDMLFMGKGGRTTRVHGPFVDDQEVEDVVNHLKSQGVPQYLEAVTEEDEEGGEEVASSGSGSADSGEGDPYDRAVSIVLKDRKVSTSYIQRRLSIGYNRAASLIERMEQEGVISAANHAGKREILVPAEDETI